MPYVGNWDPDFRQYDLGDVVSYNGHDYKIIQPHKSQSDWNPSITPALWDNIGPAGSHHGSPQPWQQQQQQQPTPQPWQQQQQQQQQPSGQPNPGVNYPEGPDHEKDEKTEPKRWDDLSDESKHNFEMAGGIAAGVGIIAAGIGFGLKYKHDKEQEKKAAFNAHTWQEGAVERSRRHEAAGFVGPPTWVLARGKEMPPNAFPAGDDTAHTLYVCRTAVDTSWQIGKASSWFKTGAVIGYGGDEQNIGQFEVLCADPRSLKWVPASGELGATEGRYQGHRLVEGGFEGDDKRTPIYIAHAQVDNSTTPGKIRNGWSAALIPKGGKEVKAKNYSVLCYV